MLLLFFFLYISTPAFPVSGGLPVTVQLLYRFTGGVGGGADVCCIVTSDGPGGKRRGGSVQTPGFRRLFGDASHPPPPRRLFIYLFIPLSVAAGGTVCGGDRSERPRVPNGRAGTVSEGVSGGSAVSLRLWARLEEAALNNSLLLLYQIGRAHV